MNAYVLYDVMCDRDIVYLEKEISVLRLIRMCIVCRFV